MTFPQFLAHLVLALIFIFAFFIALHLVVIVCVSTFYFFSASGAEAFNSPLKVFGLGAIIIFLLVPMAIVFRRVYSRLAALILRNDSLPPPLPR